MLDTIGVGSIDELFPGIEAGSHQMELEAGKSEFEVLEIFKNASERNIRLANFAGGGFYDHYIPAAVDALASKPEFYTSYTPYQPECSQGTLQSIYEYQTSICRITGMEAANASLYDGGTALAEGVLMAMRITKRSKIVLDPTVNPL